MSAGSAGEDLGTAVRRTEPRRRGAVTESKGSHRSADDLARDPGAASIADHENPLPLSGGASEDGARPANSVIHPVLAGAGGRWGWSGVTEQRFSCADHVRYREHDDIGGT